MRISHGEKNIPYNRVNALARIPFFMRFSRGVRSSQRNQTEIIKLKRRLCFGLSQLDTKKQVRTNKNNNEIKGIKTKDTETHCRTSW